MHSSICSFASAFVVVARAFIAHSIGTLNTLSLSSLKQHLEMEITTLSVELKFSSIVSTRQEKRVYPIHCTLGYTTRCLLQIQFMLFFHSIVFSLMLLLLLIHIIYRLLYPIRFFIVQCMRLLLLYFVLIPSIHRHVIHFHR